MERDLKPDKKLVTKQWCILLSLSAMIILAALLFQLLLPLSENVTSEDVTALAWPIAAGMICVLLFIFGPILVIWVKNLSYRIEEDKITIHKGILTKVQKNIPYRAITDFIVNRSIFDRILGIASIRVQTAGQTQTPTGYEGNIAGIVDWKGFHKDLRDRLRMLQSSSEAITTKEPGPFVTERDVMNQILNELKAIRKTLEKG
jgi:uncharacterized membrane protein YdbT with pleckstrin-like domain